MCILIYSYTYTHTLSHSLILIHLYTHTLIHSYAYTNTLTHTLIHLNIHLQALLELESTTDEQAAALVSSLKYLVQGEHMGARFKVLAVAAPQLGVTGFDTA
jgi:SAM-dependent MidA family methyltransferase